MKNINSQQIIMVSIVSFFLFLIIFAILFFKEPLFPWAGFKDETLWKWMELLIIPVVIAISALIFQKVEATVVRKLEQQREDNNRNLQLDIRREKALNDYLDRMSDLLLGNDFSGNCQVKLSLAD